MAIKNLPRIDALQIVKPAQMQFAQMKQVEEGDGGQLGKAISTQVQIGEIRKFRELLGGHHLQGKRMRRVRTFYLEYKLLPLCCSSGSYQILMLATQL